MDNVFLFVGVTSIAIGSYLKYEYNYKHISKISSKMDNVFLFVGVASIAIGLYLKYEYNYKHISKISPKIAKSFINCGAKLLDVRTVTEFKSGSVTREKNGNIETIAINIPGKELNDKTLIDNKLNKDDIIITFCNSGTRARQAADKLIELGYRNVYYIVETYLSLQE